jgi:glucan phosphoethanolaminetransferase (alkaline phosphatase superfamily)
MKGIPTQLIVLFCVMFIALGIYNILIARRRRQREGLQGIHTPWYKQTATLVGIEFVLLAFIFLLNIGISYGILPTSLDSVLVPFVLILMLASGVLAGFVIYQGFTSMQRRRSLAASGAQMSTVDTVHIANTGSTRTSSGTMTPEERAAYAQKRRDRRQKAAFARRRKAGKA